jgi:glutathione S-transferase
MWGINFERQLSDHPFVGGDKLHVVDLKLNMVMRWFASVAVDRVPKTVFDHCPKLMRLYREFGENLGVKAWIERTTR